MKKPDEFEHALAKVMDAARGGFGPLSTGEKLMAALCLNRGDWLEQEGYTIVEALDRIGDYWREILPEVSRQAGEQLRLEAEAGERATEATALAQFKARALPAGEQTGKQPEPIECNASFISSGWEAPGYRDTAMVFDLRPANSDSGLRIALRLSAADGAMAAEHLLGVHRRAWSRASGAPLDQAQGEARPRWIG